MHQASKHISSHTFQIGSVNPSTQIDRSRSVNSSVCLTLRPHGLKLTRLLCPWNSPGKDTGVGSHSLLQGIFLIQRWNLGLLHWGRFFTIWATREAHATLNSTELLGVSAHGIYFPICQEDALFFYILFKKFPQLYWNIIDMMLYKFKVYNVMIGYVYLL